MTDDARPSRLISHAMVELVQAFTLLSASPRPGDAEVREMLMNLGNALKVADDILARLGGSDGGLQAVLQHARFSMETSIDALYFAELTVADRITAT